MSSNDDQGGAGRREVAWRVFAAEYDDANFDYSESDEERAPNYVVTPTGARINRLFVVGVLTQIEQVSDDVLRARIVDPTGAFVVYAGQYQPDEMAFLESASPPAFVAVTGKARTFQPEDSDRVFTSVRPESINRVDAETRDRWVVQTAEQTLDRVSTFADALDSGARGDDLRAALESGGVDSGLAAGIPLAIDHYGTTKEYLAAVWDLSIDAARVVAGEIDADDVGPLDLAPDEGGDEAGVSLDYSLSDEVDVADIETTADAASEEMSPEAETPPAEARTEVGESEAVSEGSSEPEPTESVEESASADASAETTETASETAEAESGGESEAAEPESEPESETTDDDLGEAPTSTVTESEADAETEEAPEVEDAEDAADLQDEIGTDEPPTVEDEQGTTTDEAVEPETGGDDEEPDLGTAGAGDEMYEFDDEEREQIEEEHGLEFSSGSEVGEPGEADIESEAQSSSDARPGEPDEAPDAEQGPDAGTPEREAELADTEPDAGEAAEPSAEDVDTETLQDVESAQGGTEDAVNTDEQAPAGGETAAAEAPGADIGEGETEGLEAEDETEGLEAEDGGEDEQKAEPDDLESTVMETMQELNEGDGVEREVLLAAVVQEYDVTPADVEDALEAALMAGRCYEAGEDTLKPI